MSLSKKQIPQTEKLEKSERKSSTLNSTLKFYFHMKLFHIPIDSSLMFIFIENILRTSELTHRILLQRK